MYFGVIFNYAFSEIIVDGTERYDDDKAYMARSCCLIIMKFKKTMHPLYRLSTEFHLQAIDGNASNTFKSKFF